MNVRTELKRQIVNDAQQLATKPNVCIADVLRKFSILGYIQSGYFGDVYAMGLGKDPRFTAKTYTMASRSKRAPNLVMKVMYHSKLNMTEVVTLKNILHRTWKQTPHVPLYYKHFTCNQTMFRGHGKRGVAKSYDDWTFVKKGKAIIMLMEYVGKSMDKFLKVNTSPTTEFEMLFQMMYTIHVMQQHNILHGDIHMPNMTYMKTDAANANRFWEYKIGGVSYIVRVGAYIPVLIDFGQSTKGRTVVGDPKTSDALALLRTWGHYTTHEVVKDFVYSIRRAMFSKEHPDQLLPRYTQTAHIIHDFFGAFLLDKKASNTPQIQKVWES